MQSDVDAASDQAPPAWLILALGAVVVGAGSWLAGAPPTWAQWTVAGTVVGVIGAALINNRRVLRRRVAHFEAQLSDVLRSGGASVGAQPDDAPPGHLRRCVASLQGRPFGLRLCLSLTVHLLMRPLAARDLCLTYRGRTLYVRSKADATIALGWCRGPLAERFVNGLWLSLADPRTGRPVASVGLPKAGMRTEAAYAAACAGNRRLGAEIFAVAPFGPLLRSCRRSRARFWGELVVRTLPLLMISAIYEAVRGSLSRTYIDYMTVDQLILVVGLNAPWLSALVCLPIYFMLGADAASAGSPALERRLLRIVPCLWLVGIGVAGAAGWGEASVLGWSRPVVAAFVVATSLHLLASLLMVYTYLVRSLALWFGAWVCFMAAFFLWPQLWYLPPVGIITVVGGVVGWRACFARALRSSPALPEPAAPKSAGRNRLVPEGMVKGFLLASVFWGDKVLWSLKSPDAVRQGLVFLGLLPASLAFNYYYAKIVPRMSAVFATVTHSMYADRLQLFLWHKRSSAAYLSAALREMFLLSGALSLLAIPLFTTLLSYDVESICLAVGAAWILTLETAAVNTLIMLNRQREAYGICVAQLVFLLAQAYPAATAEQSALRIMTFGFSATAAAVAYLVRAWGDPEFTAFWRRQIKW